MFWSHLASLFLSDFCPISALFVKIPGFYADIFLFIFHCSGTLWSGAPRMYLGHSQWQRAHNARKRGGGLVEKRLCECAHKIILEHHLLHQDKVRSIVPVRLPFLKGTGKASSAYHAGVWQRDRNFDPAVEPTKYVWNGFLNFFHHELTQSRKYTCT